MAEAPVLVQDLGGVRRLVLNRPAQRNALDHRLIATLLELLAIAERDAAVRVVVLAGADPGFSAGADLKEAKQIADEAAIADHAALMARLMLAPWLCVKPVVAEIRGFALGAGFGLALACDAVFCADDARLGFPETRHGMLPALVAPHLLRRAGHAAAFEILVTGRDVPVARAGALGLVRPVPRDDVENEVARFAEEVAAVPAAITRALKSLLRETGPADPPGAMEIARQANVTDKLRRLRERV